MPRGELVFLTCSLMSWRICASSSGVGVSMRTMSRFVLASSVPYSSKTKATPPLMPAAKFCPTPPSTSTTPPVMYSQPWLPTPSTTSVAPELRTAKRWPARPFTKPRPPVAP